MLASHHLPSDGEERGQLALRLGDPAAGECYKGAKVDCMRRGRSWLRLQLKRPGGSREQHVPSLPWALGNTRASESPWTKHVGDWSWGSFRNRWLQKRGRGIGPLCPWESEESWGLNVSLRKNCFPENWAA